jgi:DNA-binding response OmpR family regulator
MSTEQKKTVVIVDDENAILELLKKAFEKAGYHVLLAENGLKLVAMLRTQPIDVVLLDINMPWISGEQICKSIKNDDELKTIKVLYISGVIEDEQYYWNTGCDGLFKKPFSVISVVEYVDKLFEPR